MKGVLGGPQNICSKEINVSLIRECMAMHQFSIKKKLKKCNEKAAKGEEERKEKMMKDWSQEFWMKLMIKKKEKYVLFYFYFYLNS